MNLYRFLLNLGIQKDSTRTEVKRIKLLNVFAFSWFILELFLISDAFFKFSKSPFAFYMHCVNAINIVIVILLQYQFKIKLARVYFLSAVLISNILFANFIIQDPTLNTKFFYIVIPPLSVLFINNKRINIIVFIVSYIFFSLPSYASNTTPTYDFSSTILTLSLFLCVFLIVSFFKQINTESESLLIQKQNELEHLNNFQSQFFVNISHEIKTPVTLIKAETNNLESHPNTKEIKERIEQQNSKIIKIVDDVIDLAKMKSADFKLKPKSVDLSKTLKDIQISFLSLFKQKEIAFTYLESEETIYIKANPLFFSRAINNLILNAFKYTPKKGKVGLKSYIKDAVAYIEVSDSGIGIAESDFSKIFNQFYQVNNTYNTAGGSGIGLFFTKQIIELHNGKIRIKSKPNKGSTFIIEIPLAKIELSSQELAEKSTKEPRPPIPPFKEAIPNQNILVIDDSFEMRRYLKNILTNYEFFEAANGKEALDILEQQNVNCIICDYMMPIMDGVTFVENLIEKNYTIPVLMLTAKNDRESKLSLLKLGVAEYMSKPFDEDELLIRISNILKRNKSKIDFIQNNNINPEEQNISNSWIKSVKAYLLENISNHKISQLDLAFHFNLSKSTFYRRIKTTTGLTPKEFITEIRLQEAKRLIEVEEIDTIKVVAYKVGYLQAHYFSKIYFKRFGKKPVH